MENSQKAQNGEKPLENSEYQQDLAQEEEERRQEYQSTQELINEIFAKRSQKARKSWFSHTQPHEMKKIGESEEKKEIPENAPEEEKDEADIEKKTEQKENKE